MSNQAPSTPTSAQPSTLASRGIQPRFGELMQGYVFTDNGHGNFKLPVLFIGMLLPLLLLGPGKLSVDAWVRRRCGQSAETKPTRECHDRQQLHRGSA